MTSIYCTLSVQYEYVQIWNLKLVYPGVSLKIPDLTTSVYIWQFMQSPLLGLILSPFLSPTFPLLPSALQQFFSIGTVIAIYWIHFVNCKVVFKNGLLSFFIIFCVNWELKCSGELIVNLKLLKLKRIVSRDFWDLSAHDCIG